MTQDKVPAATLKMLEPLGSLSETRLGELAALVFVEHVSKNLDPFRMQGVSGQSVYLLRGEMALTLKDGSSTVVVGGTGEARYPLGRKSPFETAKAQIRERLMYARFDKEREAYMQELRKNASVELRVREVPLQLTGPIPEGSLLEALEPLVPGAPPEAQSPAPPRAPGATDTFDVPAGKTPVVPAAADEEITTTPQAAPERVAPPPPPALPPPKDPPPGR